MIRSPAAFVRESTRLSPLDYLPQIQLYQAVGDAVDLWELTQENKAAASPPFWAFAWAGGLALARYLLEHPDGVQGRTVHDVACGSGLVAIAAAMSGAGRVVATDVDDLAVLATRINAAANGVPVTSVVAGVEDLDPAAGDLVVAGDVFYDREMAAVMLSSLRRAAEAGAEVLVGDPNRPYLPRDSIEVLAEYDVDVDRELENTSVKRAVVARLSG